MITFHDILGTYTRFDKAVDQSPSRGKYWKMICKVLVR